MNLESEAWNRAKIGDTVHLQDEHGNRTKIGIILSISLDRKEMTILTTGPHSQSIRLII